MKRALLLFVAITSAACLELEGRPCASDLDCVGAFTCVDAICVDAGGEGEGEGEGEAFYPSRCPTPPRGTPAFTANLPSGILELSTTSGRLHLVHDADAASEQIFASREIELNNFAGVVEVSETEADLVVVLNADRSASLDTTGGQICIDGVGGFLTAGTSDGALDLFARPRDPSTSMQLDTTSGPIHARVALDSNVAIQLDTLGEIDVDPAFTCFGSDPTTCTLGSSVSAIQLESTSGDLELSPL